jgi:hypothetical protein
MRHSTIRSNRRFRSFLLRYDVPNANARRPRRTGFENVPGKNNQRRGPSNPFSTDSLSLIVSLTHFFCRFRLSQSLLEKIFPRFSAEQRTAPISATKRTFVAQMVSALIHLLTTQRLAVWKTPRDLAMLETSALMVRVVPISSRISLLFADLLSTAVTSPIPVPALATIALTTKSTDLM